MANWINCWRGRPTGHRAALGRAYHELGDLTDKVGAKPEALAVHRKALMGRRALARLGTDAETVADVARSLLAISNLLEATGDTAGAFASCEEAICARGARGQRRAADDPVVAVLASSHFRMGVLQGNTGHSDEALRLHTRASSSARNSPRPTLRSPHSRSIWPRATTTSAIS